MDKKIKCVSVDKETCLAHYLCVTDAPHVFFNDNNMWEVQLKKQSQELLDKEHLNILWAANVCPVAAIKIEFEDGNIVDSNAKKLNEYLDSKRT